MKPASSLRTGLLSLILFACTGAGAQAPLPYAPQSNTPAPFRNGEPDADEAASANAAADLAPLSMGLDAVRSGDLAKARATRDALPSMSLDHRLMAWAIAISGDRTLSSGEIARAARLMADWPVSAALRRAAETAMWREQPDARQVLRAFGDTAPETVEGAILKARALRAAGRPDEAAATLRPFWRSARLSAARESTILAEFGALIPSADHRARMEQMLHYDRITSAERVAGLAKSEDLARAWSAVIRKQKDSEKLLAAVPYDQQGAGWYFARARHLRWTHHYAAAANVMEASQKVADQIVDPDAWWVERRVLSRELQDIGEGRLAYAIAAGHGAASPSMIADAEFHAGWYALRLLKDAEAARRHFAAIAAIADGPISRARAEYWLGRAAEVAGDKSAKMHFRSAAALSTTFYGQVAAARLETPPSVPAYPEPTAEDRLAFESHGTVAAIRRLEAAGHGELAVPLYLGLAAEIDSVGQIALLAVMAEKRGDYRLALRVGKAAAARGLDVGALAHPVGAIPADAHISTAGAALAYAVARQESEFNASAVSPAGARGLLQLLPGTARDMARKTGEAYSVGKLSSDAGYNAMLGAAYLTEQLDRFAGSYLLTFIGYNAGPRRADQWVERYGDPRRLDLDAVVDWVELIPFTETRNYVQRVMENYQVYKMRLANRFEMAADLTQGRRASPD